MKFTAEQAVEAITAMIDAKDKDLDLSRTITENVENGFKMVGDNETMELADFTKLVYPFVATAAGLAHKNASTATKTLQEKIAELEKQVKPQEPPKPKQQDTPPSDDIKALLDRIEKLEKDKAEADKAAKVAAKRSELKAAIAKQGVDDNEWVDTLLNEVTVAEDTDVEQKSKDYAALYQKQHVVRTSITPKTPGGKQTEQYDLSDLDTQLGQMRGDFGQKQTK